MLEGGATEPFYRPKGPCCSHSTIFFTSDYISSALHETAHWCLAGEGRRQLEDFGYWYEPDGRNHSQQAEFERVEVKPQALERIFSFACGQVFRVSADNLNGGAKASAAFVDAIHRQTIAYCTFGLPTRAGAFAQALAKEFGRPGFLATEPYRRENLT